jgi:uncharacterized membrane protein
MVRRAAVTVGRSRDEIRRLWDSPEYRPQYIQDSGAEVTFRDAPGDRGTEIHVDLAKSAPGNERLQRIFLKTAGRAHIAKVKDELRRFKQHVETGVVPRSDASPEGEKAGSKFKQRPAQPLSEEERQEVGV